MRLPLLIFLFVWAVSLKAQVNLVPNPSFEEKSSCPTGISQLSLSIGWNSPTACTPDYLHACNPPVYGYPQVGVPDNTWGSQPAHNGQAYGGFYCFNWVQHNMREYIQIELLDTIIKRQQYQVSFYVSLADDGRYSVNTIGAYFSQNPIYQNDVYNFNYEPQVKNTSANPLTDKDNWMLITETFSSDAGGERYITIGNFSDDEYSDTIYHYSGDTSYTWSYYYIDDVSVISLDTTTAMPETEKPKLKIFPNPAGNQITIEQLSVSGNQLSVEVYDALGRLVTLSVVEGQQTTIPLNLSKGVYLLRVKEKEEVVFWEKLIIE